MNIASDRKVIVTGGSSGIGRAVVERLVAMNVTVSAFDVNTKRLHALNGEHWGGKVHAFQVDVTSKASVSRAVEAAVAAMGGIDTLINCAGIIELAGILDISEESWDRVLDVNLKGTFLTCQAALPALMESGRGCIVNLSSDAGKKGWPRRGHYVASKFGVIGLTEVIAVEFGHRNVRANCVCPSSIPETAMGQEIRRQEGNPQSKEQLDRGVNVELNLAFPLGRPGSCRDVVGAIMFLISEDAEWISGEAINVDGGALTG